jgi:hypothetical protein
LIGEGFTSEAIKRHRRAIKDHLRFLCDNGLLDEEDPSCKSKRNSSRTSSDRKRSVKPAAKAEYWISHTPLNISNGSLRSAAPYSLEFGQTGYPVLKRSIPVKSRSHSNSVSSLTRPRLEVQGPATMDEKYDILRYTLVPPCQDWSHIDLRLSPKSTSVPSHSARYN